VADLDDINIPDGQSARQQRGGLILLPLRQKGVRRLHASRDNDNGRDSRSAQ
jgi:hypothetical protein